MKEIFTADTYGELSAQIEIFMEEHNAYEWPNLTIVIEKVKDEQNQDDYQWRAILRAEDTCESLIRQLCEEHEIVRHIWCKNDIRGLETTRPLTEYEVDQIAKDLEENADGEFGINWQYIQDTAYNVAPDVFREEEAEAE